MPSFQKFVVCGVILAVICGMILVSRIEFGSLRVATNNTSVPCRAALNSVDGIPLEIPTTDDLIGLSSLYNISNMSPYDPRLLRFIRRQVARPSPDRPISFTDKTQKHFSQYNESMFLDRHMKEKRDGFFIECGVLDGITHSNTLFFERERNWTGLLIEANPQMHDGLLRLNRNVYVLSACLSPKLEASKMQYRPGGLIGGLVDTMAESHRKAFPNHLGHNTEWPINCYSVNSIMAAIGVTHVDLFSLDVEGAELLILKTIDFKKLRIDRLIVEFAIVGDDKATLDRLDNFRSLFSKTKLYKEVGIVGNFNVMFERIDL